MSSKTEIRLASVCSLLLIACGGGDGHTGTDAVTPIQGLALQFPAGVQQVVCQGRTLDCIPSEDGCVLDLDAGQEGWGSDVILCQAAADDPITAPVVPLAYKGGIPLWTPNLDADNRVVVDHRSTAIAMTFLSPHLLTTSPERARFLLDMAGSSPYLPGLVSAVESGNKDAMGQELPRVVADVLAQSSLEGGLTDSAYTSPRLIDMTHVGMEAPGGNLSLSGLPGSPVDFLCRVTEAATCTVQSEADFAALDRFRHLSGKERWRIFVSASSYFKNLMLISKALGAFWKLVLPEPGEAPPEHVLTPDRIYDVQCYSGSFGGGEEEQEADWAFIGAEPDGVVFHDMARAGNLVALATETLSLFMDFGLIDSSDLYKTISGCSLNTMGEGMELSADLSVDDMLSLVWDVQWCVVEAMVKKQVNKGVMALAGFVLGNVLDKVKVVHKVGKVGVALDRLVGMTVTISPLERALYAYELDFGQCSPCENPCQAVGLKECVDESHFGECVASQDRPGCLDWVTQPCGAGKVCQGDDLCVDCGGEDETCCSSDTCTGGLTCIGSVCSKGCLEECPYSGKKECVSTQYYRECGQFDADLCLEWGASMGCGADKQCEDGECGSATCEHECWPPEKQCGSVSVLDSCGECDADDCFDFCFEESCGEGLECEGGACVCTTEGKDLPGGLPAQDVGPLDDTGVSASVLDSLWPEAELDLVGAYVADAGGYVRPRAEVEDLGVGVVYDVCLAFACDPDVNDGIMNSYNCPDGNKTKMYGIEACCLYDQTGDSVVEMTDPRCTFFGTGNDSGTMVVRVSSVKGGQCWPRYRLTLFGG